MWYATPKIFIFEEMPESLNENKVEVKETDMGPEMVQKSIAIVLEAQRQYVLDKVHFLTQTSHFDHTTKTFSQNPFYYRASS